MIFETGFQNIALAILRCVDEAGIKIRDTPISVFHVLGLKVWTISKPSQKCFLIAEVCKLLKHITRCPYQEMSLFGSL